MTTTELSTIAQEATGLAMYDRVTDPLAFIEKMGKALELSGVAGCGKPGSGSIIAWACMVKRKDPFEMAARYHFIDGKLAIKAEQMLSDFRKGGGKHKWLKDGTDGRLAELHLIGPDGSEITYKFTIEQAQQAKYVKKDSNWEKRPDQMLRSRCITDGIRMGWPEISAGDYSEDEIRDVEFSDPVNVIGRKVNRSKSTAASTVSETVIDAEVESSGKPTEETTGSVATDESSTATAEKPPFETTSGSAQKENKSQFQAIVLEIQSLTEQCGWKVSDIVAKFNQGFGTSHKNIEDFTDEQQGKMLDRIREVWKANEQKKLDAKSNEPQQ